MKVVNIENAITVIDIIPRRYVINGNTLTFEIYDEVNKITQQNISTDYTLIDGILKWSFDFTVFTEITFEEDNTYQLRVIDEKADKEDEVFYRGKLLVSKQDIQEYKLSKGLYTYE